MFVRSVLGSLSDDGVIRTRVGFSTAEEKDIRDTVYPEVYKQYYNAMVQQYIDAGYNPTRGGGGVSTGDLLVKNLSQIPMIGTVISMIGGMFGFGGKKAPEVPYRQIRAQAKELAEKETVNYIKQENVQLQKMIVEDKEAQKWDVIQKSRGQSAMITAPTHVTVEKGRLVTRVKGDTVVTPKPI